MKVKIKWSSRVGDWMQSKDAQFTIWIGLLLNHHFGVLQVILVRLAFITPIIVGGNWGLIILGTDTGYGREWTFPPPRFQPQQNHQSTNVIHTLDMPQCTISHTQLKAGPPNPLPMSWLQDPTVGHTRFLCKSWILLTTNSTFKAVYARKCIKFVLNIHARSNLY